MIDNAGNCGLVLTYNDKGWMTEVHSIGPDLKPMPVKDGWYFSKDEQDALGRSIRTTYYGAKDEPVLHKDGYHGMEPNTTARVTRPRRSTWVLMESLRCSKWCIYLSVHLQWTGKSNAHDLPRREERAGLAS